MLGRKYWAESLLSEYSAKKRWAEGSTRFPVLGFLCRVHIIFQAKDAQQISASCLETSAPEAVRGAGNSSCPNFEPKIRSSGLICPNIRAIYHQAPADVLLVNALKSGCCPLRGLSVCLL
jgi:hypothetical protein